MVSHGGTIAAAFLCWIPLITVIVSLGVAFYVTNIKAFSRETFMGKRYTGGAFKPGNEKGWRWR
jgi:hypothetical protein